ncbi:MAG: alpha/beta hydrolase [Alphaproteobacteria bacterium]|nr:alpha/beta hydrolase [Alphaproteobacteria bacterium]
MRPGPFLCAILLALFAGGCSVKASQRLLIWGTDFTLQRAVSYGPEARQKLDIYSPRRQPVRATVLFLYGGSWKTGERGLYRFLGQAMASRGYQLVVADYRLYPEVRYPAFVEDGAAAFAWVKGNIALYGGTPGTVALMGHSAGAYNAAMLAVDPRWLAPYGLTSRDAFAVVALAGPLSFNPAESDSTRDIFATAPDINAARPVKLAAAGAAAAPAMLFIHGTADTTVGFHNSQNMAKAVADAGGSAELKLYQDVSHLGVITCFAWPLRWRAPCLNDVDQFLTAQLRADNADPKD